MKSLSGRQNNKVQMYIAILPQNIKQQQVKHDRKQIKQFFQLENLTFEKPVGKNRAFGNKQAERRKIDIEDTNISIKNFTLSIANKDYLSCLSTDETI